MKTLCYILALLTLTSCRQYEYAFNYFEIKNPEDDVREAYKKVLEESENMAEIVDYNYFQNVGNRSGFMFELYKCEKEIAAILVPALEDKIEDCEGEIKGHHRLDLLVYNQNRNPVFVFFSSERNKENTKVVGPITMFLGKKHISSNNKMVIRFNEKYIRNPRKKKVKWKINKKLVLDLVLKKHLPQDISSEPSIEIERVIFRNTSKIGGNKPISFTLDRVIQTNIILTKIDLGTGR